MIYDMLRAYGVTAVIHLAELKAVDDSNVRPMTYYENNDPGNDAARIGDEESECKDARLQLVRDRLRDTSIPAARREASLGPTNPYGRTKLVIEGMLKDFCRSDEGWRIGNLR